MTTFLALGTGYGIVGLIVLILDIIALVSILTGGKSVAGKLLWTLIVVLLPVIGMILYFVIGKGGD
ncbi:MAG: PLDc_N domain-containing protein [Phycisphaerales bacterium]|nr:PLDc_N domain-containing protein [Phycisphaerales bacterium]